MINFFVIFDPRTYKDKNLNNLILDYIKSMLKINLSDWFYGIPSTGFLIFNIAIKKGIEMSCINTEKITRSVIEKLYNIPMITLPANHETPKIVLKIP
jgi:hypothetical protein